MALNSAEGQTYLSRLTQAGAGRTFDIPARAVAFVVLVVSCGWSAFIPCSKQLELTNATCCASESRLNKMAQQKPLFQFGGLPGSVRLVHQMRERS